MVPCLLPHEIFFALGNAGEEQEIVPKHVLKLLKLGSGWGHARFSLASLAV